MVGVVAVVGEVVLIVGEVGWGQDVVYRVMVGMEVGMVVAVVVD
jgi:hypothetical protein